MEDPWFSEPSISIDALADDLQRRQTEVEREKRKEKEAERRKKQGKTGRSSETDGTGPAWDDAEKKGSIQVGQVGLFLVKEMCFSKGILKRK